DNPVLWVTSLVETVALTEAYLNYGEAEDFPFRKRLPPLAKRKAQVDLLLRWLRDAEARPAWDQWIAQVEKHINLTNWAKEKEGAAYGFPHLVELRWKRLVSRLDGAAGKKDAMRLFVEEECPRIKSETEVARASAGEHD